MATIRPRSRFRLATSTAVLAAVVAGFLVGRFTGAAPAPATPASGQALAVSAPASSRPESKPPVPDVPAGELLPDRSEAIGLEGLLARLEGLRTTGDVDALLELMQEFAALGESGYPGAIEVALLLGPDRGSPLHLSRENRRLRRVFTPAMLAFGKWLLARPDQAPAWLCQAAIYGLHNDESEDVVPFVLEYLGRCADETVAENASELVVELATASQSAALARAIRAQGGNPVAQWSLFKALARLGTETALAELRELAACDDGAVAAPARAALNAVAPDPERKALTVCGDPLDHGWDSGLEWGDVVVSLGAAVLSSVDQLRRDLRAAPKNEPLTLTIERRGRLVRLEVVVNEDGSTTTTTRWEDR